MGIENLAFTCGPMDLAIGNCADLENGGVRSYPDLDDHAGACIDTVNALVSGAGICGAYITLDGMPARVPQPGALLLCLSNGRELVVSGDYQIKISKPEPAVALPGGDEQ
jgi:hypothetical protein